MQFGKAKYLEEVPCSVCAGSKLSKEVLKYKVNGLNYFQVESLELRALVSLFVNFDFTKILHLNYFKKF